MDRLIRFHSMMLVIYFFTILCLVGYISISPIKGKHTDPRYLFMIAPLGLCFIVTLISVMKNWVSPVRIGFITAIVMTLSYMLVVYVTNPDFASKTPFTINKETQNYLLLGFWLYGMLYGAGVLVSAMFIPKKHLGH